MKALQHIEKSNFLPVVKNFYKAKCYFHARHFGKENQKQALRYFKKTLACKLKNPSKNNWHNFSLACLEIMVEENQLSPEEYQTITLNQRPSDRSHLDLANNYREKRLYLSANFIEKL